MKHFYIIRFSHRHGNDLWPHFSKEAPSEEDIIENLKEGEIWDGGDEYVEITGPFTNPLYASLRRMVDGYDDTGCEECGVVDQEAYEAGKKALGDPPTERGD